MKLFFSLFVLNSIAILWWSIHAEELSIEPGHQMLTPIHTHEMIPLTPELQNTPVDPEFSHLRPPKPILTYQGNFPTIFVGLSAFRDGLRCGKTIFTGYKRAKYPEQISFGVMDQVHSDELDCLTAYCQMAEEAWPDKGPCPNKERIRIDKRDASESRGPTYARHFQQKLIRDEEFCLQLDGHSIFTNNWDEIMLREWKNADNEMAVLTTYLHHIHDFVDDEGNNKAPTQVPHLCTTIRGTREMVRNEGASMLHNAYLPQMTALWGAGLSFSKCHAERRAPVDPHTKWMFDGEEYLRSSHLWTAGYDLYSPSRYGCVIYHNYSKVPARFEHIKFDETERSNQAIMGANRVKLLSKIPFIGPVDAMELDIYGYDTVRSLEQYLEFASINFITNNDTSSCRQLRWVPYQNPGAVEKLLNWTMYPPTKKVTPAPVYEQDAKLIPPNPVVGPERKAGPKPEAEALVLMTPHPKLNDPPHLAEEQRNLRKAQAFTQTNVEMNSSFKLPFLILMAAVVAVGVVVYSNDRLWIAFTRRFRVKKTSSRN